MMLAGASLLVTAAAGGAQAAVAEDGSTLGEIVVTARRKSESLQDVPQTVNAVTADALDKLQINKFEDIQRVVPGLGLSTGPVRGQSVSLRGISYAVRSGAQPSVALYLNDVPVSSVFLFESMFDVGQVEILKGPQGTTRGIAAPSGAITVAARRPDASGVGGYVDVTATDRLGRSVEGALNLPIIRDVLAVRLAGKLDQNDVDGVRSLHNAQRPREVNGYERLGVSFEPSDGLQANLTYSHMDKTLTSFQQVSGPGQGTQANPPLAPDDGASVTDGEVGARQHLDVLILQLDTHLFGQRLTYAGSYQMSRFAYDIDQDFGNVIPGVSIPQTQRSHREQTTHEIRLASEPGGGRFLDYTVGAFYNWDHSVASVRGPGPLLPGAFGSPAQGVNLNAYNPAYQIPILTDVSQGPEEISIFGGVTLHLGSRTELSAGGRHIWSIFRSSTRITRGAGLTALPAGLVGGNCAAAGLASSYPGFCDRVVPGGAVVGDFPLRTSEQPDIYNVSLSHRLSRDVLVYANTGTSYRPPVASIGLQGDIVASTDPLLRSLSFHPAERSRSLEAGVKATFLEGRARINASVFRQKFENLIIYVPGIAYLTSAANPGSPSVFNMSASVDARVQGFDLDTSFRVTRDWNVSVQASYSDGKVRDSLVPCNLTDAAGRPVFNTAGLISFCPGGSSSRLPLWNATLQSDYSHPLTDGVDAFVRGLLTYYPENRRAEPNFTVADYSLVNLYLGVRSHDGAWEVSLFARNAFNMERATDIQTQQLNANTSLGTTFASLIRPSGYYATEFTPRREVGINARYTFGGR